MFENSSEEMPDRQLHVEPTRRARTRAHMKWLRWAVLVVCLVGLVITICLMILSRHKTSQSQILPASITNQISSFTVYTPKAGSSTDFTVIQSSASYTDGVLLFAMRNPVNLSVTVTEQRIPAGYDSSQLQVSQRFSTEYGNALITDNPDRTTGALFTADHTWILINAPTPIGLDAMKELINSFGPVLHS